MIVKKRLNDAGAALVTVIVVIAFVSVMVTVLLYASGINYYMKTTDMHIKGSFYDAEVPLEQVKAGMMEEAGKAFEKAYGDVMANFSVEGDAAARKNRFYHVFVDEFVRNWNANVLSAGSAQDYLKRMVDNRYAADLTLSGSLELHQAEGYVIIKGVGVTHEVDGYLTLIETDFVVKAPDIDWSLESSERNWGAEADALDRKPIDMAKCVGYINWTKK